jgi:cyclopropane fatty-acyl-phospholipid synthase-like methyltransferase
MTKKTIFDYQAEVGLTKHMGGLEATEKFIHQCEIGPEDSVLDVGCGVGQTAVLLVKRCGCHVTGVDISEGMIKSATERARKHGVTDKTEFRQGEISNLPFNDDRFDVVLSESVTTLALDHAKAIREYVRVLKPGGVLGLNEVLYLNENPPEEIIAWLAQDVSGGAHTRHVESWKTLLQDAGFRIEGFEVHPPDIGQELKGLLKRYGCIGYLGIMARTLRMYLRDPEYRTFVREIQGGGVVPKNLIEYIGYGLFIARKS